MSDAYFVALAQAAVVHEVPSEWKYAFLVPNSDSSMLQSARIVDVLSVPMPLNDYLMLFDQTSSTSNDPVVLKMFTELLDHVKDPSLQDTRTSAHARKLLMGTRFEKYFVKSSGPQASQDSEPSQDSAPSIETQETSVPSQKSFPSQKSLPTEDTPDLLTVSTVSQRFLRKLKNNVPVEKHNPNLTQFVNGST